MIQHQKRFRLVAGIVAGTAIILALMSFFYLKSQKPLSPNEKVVPVFHQTFHKDGILFEKNGLLHFIDAKSGKDIVLCDKPNCPHTGSAVNSPQPTCNAAIDGICMDGYGIYRGQLYFISQTDSGGIFNKEIYQADVNGANRKRIAELENVEFIENVTYVDEYLLVPYITQNDPDSPNVELEKPIVGMAAINLSTYEVTYIPTKEGYNPSIWQAHEYKGEFYYIYTYLDIKTNEDETVDEQNHFFVELYSYDPATKSETKLVGGNNLSFLAFDGVYAYLIERTKEGEQVVQVKLTDGTKEAIFQDTNLRPSFFVDGNNLIYSIDIDNGQQWRLFDTKTKEISNIGKLLYFNDEESFGISAMIKDKVYIFYTDPEKDEFCDGYLSKQDFYDGKFDRKIPLLYPNEV